MRSIPLRSRVRRFESCWGAGRAPLSNTGTRVEVCPECSSLADDYGGPSRAAAVAQDNALRSRALRVGPGWPDFGFGSGWLESASPGVHRDGHKGGCQPDNPGWSATVAIQRNGPMSGWPAAPAGRPSGPARVDLPEFSGDADLVADRSQGVSHKLLVGELPACAFKSARPDQANHRRVPGPPGRGDHRPALPAPGRSRRGARGGCRHGRGADHARQGPAFRPVRG